jgi:ABC-type transporter Mla MlaB component
MLRIDSRDESELTTFTIEGKLAGRWVKELEDCWRCSLDSNPQRSIRVNLSSVGFIDSEGKALLIRMRKQGAELVPTGCFMRVIVDEIESEVAKG